MTSWSIAVVRTYVPEREKRVSFQVYLDQTPTSLPLPPPYCLLSSLGSAETLGHTSVDNWKPSCRGSPWSQCCRVRVCKIAQVNGAQPGDAGVIVGALHDAVFA